ncbi:hypothetical protein BJF93_20060 [Xaviernesmea oryzae]|uniref:Uncharacterized protein n=1 Tax=Xaviernesmea oryzae TaxID=464029 RepID=A0A1Q9B3U9_9HYPH|nr:hypothetical protein [Xaviernesmea oryzae]OLP62776.1 hypothetical protein BJF93_20060 [Xaviernesmea oryzae]
MSVSIDQSDPTEAKVTFGYGAESHIFIKIPTSSLKFQIREFLQEIEVASKMSDQAMVAASSKTPDRFTFDSSSPDAKCGKYGQRALFAGVKQEQ